MRPSSSWVLLHQAQFISPGGPGGGCIQTFENRRDTDTVNTRASPAQRWWELSGWWWMLMRWRTSNIISECISGDLTHTWLLISHARNTRRFWPGVIHAMCYSRTTSHLDYQGKQIHGKLHQLILGRCTSWHVDIRNNEPLASDFIFLISGASLEQLSLS